MCRGNPRRHGSRPLTLQGTTSEASTSLFRPRVDLLEAFPMHDSVRRCGWAPARMTTRGRRDSTGPSPALLRFSLQPAAGKRHCSHERHSAFRNTARTDRRAALKGLLAPGLAAAHATMPLPPCLARQSPTWLCFPSEEIEPHTLGPTSGGRWLCCVCVTHTWPGFRSRRTERAQSFSRPDGNNTHA